MFGHDRQYRTVRASMKAPPKRKGNWLSGLERGRPAVASMKAPPKRKGNFGQFAGRGGLGRLNESPSEKEGKLG